MDANDKTVRALTWLPFLVSVPVLLLLALRGLFFGTGPVSIGLQLAALVLNFSARAVFRLRSFHAGAATTRGALVTTGPYRFIRHPVYASILLALVGAMVAHPVPFLFAGCAVMACATLMRVALEEETLRATYPEYEQYASHTKRILPGLW